MRRGILTVEDLGGTLEFIGEVEEGNVLEVTMGIGVVWAAQDATGES